MSVLQHIFQIDFDGLDVKVSAIVEMTLFGIIDMFIFWADELQFTYENMVEVIHGYMQDGITPTLAKAYGISLHLP